MACVFYTQKVLAFKAQVQKLPIKLNSIYEFAKF